MTARKVVLTRPATRYPSGAPVSSIFTSTNAATPSRTHAPVRECTPTTNVVSGVHVRDARNAHARTHAREEGEEVTDVLERMSAQQKKELLDRLLLEKHAADTATGSNRDVDMWATAVYTALVRVTRSSDPGLVGPGVVRRLLGVGAVWRPVAEFMQATGLMELTVTERQAAYYMLADLLVAHARVVARRSGAPLGAKLVGQCVTNLPGLVDQSFPGYAEAGMLKVVARQRMAH